jgi:hypothetical protein
MNCETYLSMLATLPIDELTLGDARAHVAACRDCDRVSRVVAERERNMLMAFGELYPPTPADPIATRALEISRRRRVGRYYNTGLMAAAAAMLLSLFVVRRVVPAPTASVKETFRLQCLSPEQAIEILRPEASKNLSVFARPNSALGVIDVAGPRAELEVVRSLIDRYDNPAASQCGVQLTVPKAIRSP